MCIDGTSYVSAAQSQATAMITYASIDTAIQVALALWKRNASSSITDLQDEIAKRNIALAEEIHNHVKNFWPFELSAVADAFGLAYQHPQYDALSRMWAGYNDDTHDLYMRAMYDELKQKCIITTPCEFARWNRNRQRDRAQCMYFADRHAEVRADTMNDKRYAEQYAVLGLGKGHLGNVRPFAEIAGQSAAASAGQMEGMFNNAMEAFSYYRRPSDNWGDSMRIKWSAVPDTTPQISTMVPTTRAGDTAVDNKWNMDDVWYQYGGF